MVTAPPKSFCRAPTPLERLDAEDASLHASQDITTLSMSSFNKVILMGNLTRDPELRYTPKGTAVAKLGLAVNRKWRTESGEEKEEVAFIDVDCFGKQAETVGQYLKKGRPLFVEGRLTFSTWDDKTTGKKRSKLGVVMESFQFLDKGTDAGTSAAAPAPSRAERAQADLGTGGKPEEDDSVPF